MKIGLVRHFKVKQPYPRSFLITHQQISDWFVRYDTADIASHEVDMQGINWQRCHASPLSRAHKTARHLFTGEIQLHDELQELNVLPLMNNRLVLPLILWGLLVRRKTLAAGSTTAVFKEKLNALLDTLLGGEETEILIVSHGLVMIFLQQELKARGFKGDAFRNAENGRIYVFEKAL